MGPIAFDAEMLEWLLEASRLATMGRLLPSVIHQLSTPLAAIALRVEGLERTLLAPDLRSPASDKTERYLRAMGEEAQRCRELLAALRDFVRGGEAEPLPVDLALLCRGAATLVRHEALRRQVVIEPVEGSVPTVPGQAHRLAQAVLALVLNAVEASPAGGKVTIEARAEGRRVSVTVSDEGTGIPQEVRARILDPSFAARRQGPGLGLGLLACRAIAEAHGGRLELPETSPRRGRAVLSLPVDRPAGEPADGRA